MSCPYINKENKGAEVTSTAPAPAGNTVAVATTTTGSNNTGNDAAWKQTEETTDWSQASHADIKAHFQRAYDAMATYVEHREAAKVSSTAATGNGNAVSSAVDPAAVADAVATRNKNGVVESDAMRAVVSRLLVSAMGYTDEDLSIIGDDVWMVQGTGNPHRYAKIAAGESVVDLGSGFGIDAFLAAARVGPFGRVFGIDQSVQEIAAALKRVQRRNNDAQTRLEFLQQQVNGSGNGNGCPYHARLLAQYDAFIAESRRVSAENKNNKNATDGAVALLLPAPLPPKGTPNFIRNVDFRLGDIERPPLEDSTIDCVISNGGFCLVPDKPGGFREIFRILRKGNNNGASNGTCGGGRMVICCTGRKKPLPALPPGKHYPSCFQVFIAREEVEAMLGAIGFVDIAVDDSDSNMDIWDEVKKVQKEMMLRADDGAAAVTTAAAAEAGGGGCPYIARKKAEEEQEKNSNKEAAESVPSTTAAAGIATGDDGDNSLPQCPHLRRQKLAEAQQQAEAQTTTAANGLADETDEALQKAKEEKALADRAKITIHGRTAGSPYSYLDAMDMNEFFGRITITARVP